MEWNQENPANPNCMWREMHYRTAITCLNDLNHMWSLLLINTCTFGHLQSFYSPKALQRRHGAKVQKNLIRNSMSTLSTQGTYMVHTTPYHYYDIWICLLFEEFRTMYMVFFTSFDLKNPLTRLRNSNWTNVTIWDLWPNRYLNSSFPPFLSNYNILVLQQRGGVG